MLWYKSWLDTRSRFLAGLVLLALSACGAVFYYPQVLKLMPMASTIEASGELGRRIREGVALASNYRGSVDVSACGRRRRDNHARTLNCPEYPERCRGRGGAPRRTR